MVGLLDYWWVALLVGAVIMAITYGVKKYHEKKQAEAPLQAQFVVTGSVLIGCIMFIFSVVGIVSAILGILSAILKLICWKLGI
jgi:Ca2+/Na+ antiporter